MFWIGVATLMMAVSGVGDDTRPFRDWLDAIRDGLREELPDKAKQDKAIALVDDTEALFRVQREGLDLIAQCVEKADRNYAATEQDYVTCFDGMGEVHMIAIEGLIGVRQKLHVALTPEERQRVRTRLTQR